MPSINTLSFPSFLPGPLSPSLSSFLPSVLYCWVSSRGSFAPQGTFGNVSRHFWLSQLVGALGIQWVEVSDTAKPSTVHRIALPFILTTKNYPVQNVSSAKDEEA